MVHLVALLEAAQNRNGVFHRWLVHQHLLETPLQRRILLDVLAVFIQGCGADATQLPPGEHRFQQVAGIHGSAAGASPHHGVDLIDEEHDLPLRGRHLLEDGLEALLEFTAVLRSGDQ